MTSPTRTRRFPMRRTRIMTTLAAVLLVGLLTAVGATAASAAPPGQGPGGPSSWWPTPGPVLEVLRRDPASGGPQRVRRRRRGSLTPAQLAGHQVVVLGADGADRRPGLRCSTQLGQRGGNLIAMRPDAKLAGCSASAPPPATLSDGYIKIDTERGARRRHHRRDDAVPRHRRPLTRSTGATTVATLYTDATTATHVPGRDAAQRRHHRRPGGRVHLRPGALGRLHAPGQPGVGGPGARRRDRPDPLATTCSSARRPATSSPTGSTSTRSRSRRPTSSSGCWPT